MEKKLLKIFGIFVFIILFFTINCLAAEEIIYIESVEDYNLVAQNCAAYNGYKDRIIVLTADLDFQGQKTEMFNGTFKGVFDGRGHKLQNIRLDNDDYDNWSKDIGLFEDNAGLIRKIIVESGTIQGKSKTGAICANNSGIVEQCANLVDIQSEFVIGGIVGWNENQGLVRVCYNRGNITDLQPGSGGTIGFGGIVGYVYSGTIIDCYNTGIITPERDVAKGNITSSYYEDDESEFLDNCYILADNVIGRSADDFCIKVREMDGSVLSNLNSNNKFFYLGDSGYPEIIMAMNMDGLPDPIKIRRENHESNPFFENDYHTLVAEANNLDIPIVNTGVVDESGEWHDGYIWHNEEPEENVEDEAEKEVNTEYFEEDVIRGDDKYLKIKKDEIQSDSFGKHFKDTSAEEKKFFFGGLNFWLVVGGFFIIILVFMRALVDNSTTHNDDN